MKKIFIADFTLSQLAAERENPLLAREKNLLARSIEALGVDAIELPPVRNVKEDTMIHKTIASGVKNACLSVPVGETEREVDEAWEGVREAEKPILQIILPVSTVQMEYRFHMKEEKMAAKINELVSYARQKGCPVEFVARDASRASEKFLIQALRAAESAGSDRVTLCDDVGVGLPEDVTRVVTLAKAAVSIPVYVFLSDSIHCACANAITAIRAGADGVKCAVTGRDALHTGDLAAALAAVEDALKIATDLHTTEIHSDISAMLKRMTRTDRTEEKAPSGVSVFLDGSSNPGQVAEAARALGYDLSPEDLGKVLEAVIRVCEKKSGIGAKELEAVIASSAMQVPSTYHLVSFQTTSSNVTHAMASICLSRGDETLCGVATGDGPIDSSFKAIEQTIGHHYELDDFQIQAVTEGREALGSALVRLRSRGKLYAGNGLSADIVGASIRAYINALNKIVYEETEQ